MGDSLKGKDKKIIPLLYCLAVYGASEEEMIRNKLDTGDIDVVKRVGCVLIDKWNVGMKHTSTDVLRPAEKIRYDR